MAATPGITLAQAQAWLLEAQGVRLGTTATWQSARRLGLSFKKTLRAAEQDRPDVAARRTLWKAAQPFIDPHSLVFLDGEADQKGVRGTPFPPNGVNTRMARLYGRSASAAATPCRSATGRR